MADWRRLYEELGGIGTAFGERAREKIKREQELENILLKAQIEQAVKAADPYQQALTKIMETWTERMGGKPAVTPTPIVPLTEEDIVRTKRRIAERMGIDTFVRRPTAEPLERIPPQAHPQLRISGFLQ